MSGNKMISECFNEFTFYQLICIKNAVFGEDFFFNIQQNVSSITFQGIIIGIILIALAVILLAILYITFLPLNWTRDINSVGYYYVSNNNNCKTSFVNAINRIRRTRKIGEKLPSPYPNGWFCLAESREVGKSKVISVNALGENFAIFRTESGKITVIDAYCPHLGANLGVGGIVIGDCIECPFHQWRFSGESGQCVSIPYSSTNYIPKNATIKIWKSLEVNDGIFVWYHAENDEPWELPIAQEIIDGKWKLTGRNEFYINCHIQEIPENGADVSHLKAVHGPSMLAGSDLSHSRDKWAQFSAHAWDASWQANTDESKLFMATMKLKHSIRLFDMLDICTMNVIASQIGPGYVKLHLTTSYGDFVILQTVTPVEALVQKVVHRFYLPKLLATVAKFIIWGESVMFERDIMVWNHKKYIDKPCLVKEDRLIKAYRTWYSQFYSENSKSFNEASSILDW